MRKCLSACAYAVIFCFTTLLVLHAAQGRKSIGRSGATTITMGAGGQAASITVRTIAVRKSDAMFPATWTWSDQVLAVQELTISVNGETLFVPSSAYVDLVEPREMLVSFDKGAFILEIHGADASESYFVRIYFDRRSVKRRLVYSSLDSRRPTQDSRYFTADLKDKG
jgi:hypothetical protein